MLDLLQLVILVFVCVVLVVDIVVALTDLIEGVRAGRAGAEVRDAAEDRPLEMESGFVGGIGLTGRAGGDVLSCSCSGQISGTFPEHIEVPECLSFIYLGVDSF